MLKNCCSYATLLIGDYMILKKKTINFIAICLIFISVILFIIWHKDKSISNKITNSLLNDINLTESSDNGVLYNAPDDIENKYWNFANIPFFNTDLSNIIQKNNNTIAWLYIPNTKINYPVLQTNDNNYYLRHSFDNSYNRAGWIFMDYRNSTKEFDKNTIIYGHNRMDKTFFGSLDTLLDTNRYKNEDFNNMIIHLSTKSQNTLWQIISVYKTTPETYYLTTNFNTNDEYINFLNSISSKSIYNFDTSLNENDKILTLSTCSNYIGSGRLVIHAKLIKYSNK